VPLVLERHSGQQRVVIRRKLVELIVADEDHLHLLHVVLLIHLESAAIDYLLQGGFSVTSIELILVEEVVDRVRELMALFKALMVSAYEHDTQIGLLKANVDVEHVLLSAARDADRCPCLTIRHRSQRHHKVKDHRHIFRLDLIELIREHVDNIQTRNHHAES